MEILNPIVYLSYEALSAYCSNIKETIKDNIASDEYDADFVADVVARFENEKDLIKDEMDMNIHVGFELEALQKNYNLMGEVLKHLRTMMEEGE